MIYYYIIKTLRLTLDNRPTSRIVIAIPSQANFVRTERAVNVRKNINFY